MQSSISSDYTTIFPATFNAIPGAKLAHSKSVFKQISCIFQSSKEPGILTRLPVIQHQAGKYPAVPVMASQQSDMHLSNRNFECFKRVIKEQARSPTHRDINHLFSMPVKFATQALVPPVNRDAVRHKAPDSNEKNKLHVSDDPAVKEQAIVCRANNEFGDYLKQYHDELPELKGNFKEIRIKNENLNCHCYAVKLNDGYDSPADSLKKNMDKQQIIDAITSWYEQKGYQSVAFHSHHEPFKRDIRKEKIVVFGITPEEARNLLARRGAISEDLQSTLATAMQFNRQIIYPTHSICQNIAGNWESKMGTGPVIEIPHPDMLSTGVYGKPCFLFEKKRT